MCQKEQTSLQTSSGTSDAAVRFIGEQYSFLRLPIVSVRELHCSDDARNALSELQPRVYLGVLKHGVAAADQC